MTDRIPREVLAAARLRFKRRCAAVICALLADSGCSEEEIEARLGWRPGCLWREIRDLLSGKAKSLDRVADIATAMGCELVPGSKPFVAEAYCAADAEEPRP